MNLKSTLLALMLVISVSVFATGYYVTVDGAGDAFYFCLAEISNYPDCLWDD